LLFGDRWQCGDIGLNRGIEVSFEYSDIDVFGEPSDKPIGLAQAGAALEVEVDRIVLASVEQEIKGPQQT
jgi:hypothetical protein